MPQYGASKLILQARPTRFVRMARIRTGPTHPAGTNRPRQPRCQRLEQWQAGQSPGYGGEGGIIYVETFEARKLRVWEVLLVGMRHGVGDDVGDVRIGERVLRFAAVASDLDETCGSQGSEVLRHQRLREPGRLNQGVPCKASCLPGPLHCALSREVCPCTNHPIAEPADIIKPGPADER